MDIWFEQPPQLGTLQSDHLYQQQQASVNAYQPQPGYMQQEQQQQQVLLASSSPISSATTDRTELGWAVVHEYIADELAENPMSSKE